jgi:hypothetical protein
MASAADLVPGSGEFDPWILILDPNKFFPDPGSNPWSFKSSVKMFV